MTTNRTYQLTAAGTSALMSERSVPPWYRTILGLLHRGEASPGKVCGCMPAYPGKQVLAWLEQLETLGFIEIAAELTHDAVLAAHCAA